MIGGASEGFVWVEGERGCFGVAKFFKIGLCGIASFGLEENLTEANG